MTAITTGSDAGAHRARGDRETATSSWTDATVGRHLLLATAVCSGVAAGVHFAFAPDHFAEDWKHGLFFIAIAWAQLVWAFLVLSRPRRGVLLGGVGLNLGIIGVWTLSRTVGLPFDLGGAVEPIGRPDVLCTVLEGLIVLGAFAVAYRPSLLDRRSVSTRTGPAAIATFGVAAVVLASFSVTPAWAGVHNHAAGGHTHAAAGGGPFATGTSPCERSGPPSSPEQVANTTQGHSHRGAQAQVVLDAAARQQLIAQQTDAAAVAAKFPTAADAMKAGYRLSVVYVPCIGAHYTNVGYVGSFDPKHPSELLYDGSSPTSKIVGLSYLLFHRGGPPEGFVGPNDHWHQHTFNGGLCLNDAGVVIGGESSSKARCEARGGHKAALTDIWMLHDWVVPGWECSWGVFAPECPELGGRTGGTAFDTPTAASRTAAGASGE